MTAEDFLAFAAPLPDALLLIARDGTVLAANDAAGRLVGRPPASLGGRRLADLATDAPGHIERALRRWARSSAPTVDALHLLHADGSVVECRGDGALLVVGGRPAGRLLLRCRPRARDSGGSRFIALNQTIERLHRTVLEWKQADAERAALLARERAARAEAETATQDNAVRAARLRTLARLNQLVSSTLDSTKVLTEIAGAAAALMEAQLVSIWIADEQTRTLQRAAFSDEPLGLSHPAETVRFGEGGVGWVAAHREPIDTPLIAVDERFVAREWFEERGLRSALELPIMLEGRLLGVLALFAGGPFGAHPDRGEILDAFVTQAALAIRNAGLYEEAERRRREAEAASRAKDDFLAVLSHELRTPLTAMLGWIRLIRMGGLPPERVRQAMAIIERNTRMQAQLISDLLEVSRIVAGKLELDPQPLDLPRAVEEAVEMVRPDAEVKGVRLTTALARPAAPVVGDVMRLQQVVTNLVSNAIKFTPARGAVDVRLDDVPAGVRLTVRDTGVGIPAAVLPYVFDRFRQADSSITRGHGGLGLGLAIVRHLVELHGGSVTAASAGEGLGAVFTVELPVGRAPRDAAKPPARPRGPAGALQGVRLLLVEDDADTRDLVALVLRECGAEVQAVAAVEEGWRLLRAGDVDVLVSDLGLPGVDGFELIHRLRADERGAGRPRLRAIALTAYAGGEDRERALGAGFDVYVPKPVDPRELAELVARAVGR